MKKSPSSALSLKVYSGSKSACDGSEPMKMVRPLYEAQTYCTSKVQIRSPGLPGSGVKRTWLTPGNPKF
jgi:hypothetical protein